MSLETQKQQSPDKRRRIKNDNAVAQRHCIVEEEREKERKSNTSSRQQQRANLSLEQQENVRRSISTCHDCTYLLLLRSCSYESPSLKKISLWKVESDPRPQTKTDRQMPRALWSYLRLRTITIIYLLDLDIILLSTSSTNPYPYPADPKGVHGNNPSPSWFNFTDV